MIAKLCLSVIIAFSFIALPCLIAQQRVLLYINKDGQQEAISIRKGERTEDALSRLDKMTPDAVAGGTRDSITNYGKNGATNFIASHQDVMFQWFDPQAGGYVLEFGWRNGTDIGTITKSTIRAWKPDIRLLTLPASALSKSVTGTAGNMGYYIKSNDGDGLKTPFKNEATNATFVKGKGDTSITFDPLGTEAPWLAKGWQFSLVSGSWQSFRLLDFGDTIKFNVHEPFGFTKQNDTKIGDIGGAAGDVNMLIGANSADQYAYHSLKFYEGTPASNYGWQVRDYEWNFYAVVMYTSDRPPKISSFTKLSTTLKTTARTVTANITDDNPGGGAAGVASVKLYSKINSGAYTNTTMTLGTAPTYTGTIPGANPNDSVTYYIVATDVNNLSTTSVMTSYSIFNITKKVLFMWNGRSYPTGILSPAIMAQYGMMKDSLNEPVWYDVWDVKKYGTADIPTLLKSYNGVVEATGDGGYAQLTYIAGDWLTTGTPASPKSWFMADQDYGFIGWGDPWPETAPEAKYFGVKALINQDYPYYYAGSPSTYVSKPWQLNLVAKTDPVFSFINTKMINDSITFWYDPNHEWPPFQNWMDEFIPTATATVLFRDMKYDSIIVGVRNSAPDKSWNTVWLAFDYLSTDFRSDTSKTLAADPKYKSILSAGNPASRFIKATTGISSPDKVAVPDEFALQQNYPNPFNPVTVIS